MVHYLLIHIKCYKYLFTIILVLHFLSDRTGYNTAYNMTAVWQFSVWTNPIRDGFTSVVLLSHFRHHDYNLSTLKYN